MIRDASFQDVPELLAMLHEMQAASKYAGRVDVVDKAAEAVLMGLIAGQRQSGPQASFCAVNARTEVADTSKLDYSARSELAKKWAIMPGATKAESDVTNACARKLTS